MQEAQDAESECNEKQLWAIIMLRKIVTENFKLHERISMKR